MKKTDHPGNGSANKKALPVEKGGKKGWWDGGKEGE